MLIRSTLRTMAPFADYVLIRRLDSGGDVELYEARHPTAHEGSRLLVRAPNAGRWPPWADPGLARVLRHRNIVRMYESSVSPEHATFLFELVHGLDLREILAGEPLPPHLALHVVREACCGLAAALESHAPDGTAVRIMHGAMSARVVHVSTEGEVKVSGFGTGRLKPEGAPQLDSLSPEQRAGKGDAHDAAASDVFLVGLILRAMFASGASPALSTLIDQMLAPRPEDRPRDALEVIDRMHTVPELSDRASAGEELGACIRERIDGR